LIPDGMQGIILSAKAFAPAHITGFFETHQHSNPVMKGSTGCGIVLNSGVETTVTIGEDIKKTDISLNGKAVSGSTIATVIEMITDIPVAVHSQANIPVECGLGASGAGALSTSYALNEALSLNLTANKLNEIAHVAEVKNSSGLGDVAAQNIGGIAIRNSPGAPDIARHDRIPCPEIDVYCIVLGELPTDSVLGNEEMVGRINLAGRKAMNELMKAPSVDNFMSCSKTFCTETGLANEKVIDIIEAVESINGMASQAMLGNTVFAISSTATKELLEHTLSEFGNVLHYKTNSTTVRLI